MTETNLKTQSELEIIATVSSPFKEKFGIPRQPRLADSAVSQIVFKGKFNAFEYVKGIEQHSHIWLLFLFHQNLAQGYKAQVRPPRLGGNEKVGVFATRATFRPNGIGMSAVKLLSVEQIDSQVILTVEGADLLDGTPIVDIKPYIPYSDCLPEASSEMAQEQQAHRLLVEFSEQAKIQLDSLNVEPYPNLISLIKQVLEQDPRPAYKKTKTDNKEYGIRLYDLNIKWQVNDNSCLVLTIQQEQ